MTGLRRGVRISEIQLLAYPPYVGAVAVLYVPRTIAISCTSCSATALFAVNSTRSPTSPRALFTSPKNGHFFGHTHKLKSNMFKLWCHDWLLKLSQRRRLLRDGILSGIRLSAFWGYLLNLACQHWMSNDLGDYHEQRVRSVVLWGLPIYKQFFSHTPFLSLETCIRCQKTYLHTLSHFYIGLSDVAIELPVHQKQALRLLFLVSYSCQCYHTSLPCCNDL